MMNTVPSSTSVSKPLALAGLPNDKTRDDKPNFSNELSDAISAAANDGGNADLTAQTVELQPDPKLPIIAHAHTLTQDLIGFDHQSKNNIHFKTIAKQADGDKTQTSETDTAKPSDETPVPSIDPAVSVNSLGRLIPQKSVQGILIDKHLQKSPDKTKAHIVIPEGQQPVTDISPLALSDAMRDHSDRNGLSMTKRTAATKPASGDEKGVSAKQEAPQKKDDTPANQTALEGNPIDPLTPNLFMADAPLISSSANSVSSAHESADALKLTTTIKRTSSNKNIASQEMVADGVVTSNEATSAVVTGMQANHLTEKLIKANSHTGLRAEKSDQTVSTTQDGSPNPTIKPIKADANQDLSVPTLQNGEVLIGKDQLPKALQDQLSNIGTAGSTTAASRGPIPYAMLPIELGLSALNGKRSIDVLLSPAELGAVEIRLEVSNHSEVKAHIKADRPETLTMLMNDSYALKSALDQTGMTTTTDSLQFSLRQDSQQQSNSNNPSHQHANKPQRAYEGSDTPSDATMREAIPLKPLTRGIGLLDVQI